jgi:hypothetical protein
LTDNPLNPIATPPDRSNIPQASLSPHEREQQKNRREKHDDWAYTASHAVVCLATDMYTPITSHLFQGKKSNLWSHVEGEIYGDLLGIPATIAMQRYCPEATAAIRAVVEPIMRPVYEKSAEHYARAWAQDHGEAIDSEAYEEHKTRHYEREMGKLPLGIVWSLTSMLMNAGYQIGKQQLSDRLHLNLSNINEGSPAEVFMGTLKGAALTFALTNGARIVVPRQVHKLDRWVNNTLAEPLANAVDSVMGQGTVVPPESKQMSPP